MDTRIPLPTLLSQILVAFTIELDNEAEHRMRHSTTAGRRAGEELRGPWLVSLAMWLNFMQYLPDEGLPLGELVRLARLERVATEGMTRWRYVTIAPAPGDPRPKPPKASWLVVPTRAGRRAQEVWRPLPQEIEDRWRSRFGDEAIQNPRQGLASILDQAGCELPDFLPTVGYGLWSRVPLPPKPEKSSADRLPLIVLLAKVLLIFATELEDQSSLSMAISANTMRVLTEHGIPQRDLPRLTGVSKELIAVSLGFLEKAGYLRLASNPASRGTTVHLTPTGLTAQASCQKLRQELEREWESRFGESVIASLRASLAGLLDARDNDASVLARGLVPPPKAWRGRLPYLTQTKAMLRDPAETLPHFPVVSHRGGYPDGS